MCSGCFEGHVESECDRPEFDGSIVCPFNRLNECDCTGFSQRFILGQLHDDAFKEYERKRDAQKERELVIKLEAQIEERVRKEMEASNGDEKHRQHIIENFLTLRCPNKKCRAAYFEFDGCLSVMCSMQDVLLRGVPQGLQDEPGGTPPRTHPHGREDLLRDEGPDQAVPERLARGAHHQVPREGAAGGSRASDPFVGTGVT